VITILKDLFLYIAMPFLNNIRVKGPYIDYVSKETLLGIRRFVFKHILNLNKTLNRVKRARAYIGSKS
jgi:hypothetical protein